MRPVHLALLVAGLLFLAIVATAQAFLPIETFSNYKVEIKLLENGDAHITHRITIRNNDRDSPIVPGIAYLNVFNNQEKNLEIADLSAKMANGSRIVHFLQSHGDYYEIRFELWFPLGPQKEQEVILEYTAKNFYPKNGLFRTIQFPVGESTIPIEKSVISLESPLAITYAPGARSENNRLEWNLGTIPSGESKSIEFEASNVPLPALPIKGAYVFYSLLTIIGLTVIVIGASFLRKQRKRDGR